MWGCRLWSWRKGATGQGMQAVLNMLGKQGCGFAPPTVFRRNCCPANPFWNSDLWNCKIIHSCVFSHHVCGAIYHCSNGKLTQLQVSISKVGCTVWLADKGPDTWNCGIGKEKVGFNWDLVSGIGICVIDRSWVSLDPVIKLCSPASLKSKQRWLHEAENRKTCAIHSCIPLQS